MARCGDEIANKTPHQTPPPPTTTIFRSVVCVRKWNRWSVTQGSSCVCSHKTTQTHRGSPSRTFGGWMLIPLCWWQIPALATLSTLMWGKTSTCSSHGYGAMCVEEKGNTLGHTSYHTIHLATELLVKACGQVWYQVLLAKQWTGRSYCQCGMWVHTYTHSRGLHHHPPLLFPQKHRLAQLTRACESLLASSSAPRCRSHLTSSEEYCDCWEC